MTGRVSKPMPDATDSGLRAVAVGKSFSGLRALFDVSLEVELGEIVGLIGPNGSGKTTLLNVATGVLAPSQGRIVVDGHDLTGKPPHAFAHRGIGRTFQQVRLFSDMSVRQNVEIGAISRRQNPRGVQSILNELELSQVSDRLAGTLAYGMQRRVEIARAVAGSPHFLLLDEPAAGMNEEETDRLLETIQGVRTTRGCGVLIVDHDLRLIMRLCERIHVLANGTTIAEGTPSAVRNDPAVITAYLGSHASATEGGGG